MCRLLGVARSGFYQWLHKSTSDRALEDARLLVLIRDSYNASHGIYGSPRICLDLREIGERCSENRVARIMKKHQIKTIRGYKAPKKVVGRPSLLVQTS